MPRSLVLLVAATMHANVDAVITNTARKQNVVLVYHHIRVYADDPIYQANTTEPTQRATFLRGVQGTPTVFFNGLRWTSGYAGWPNHLDALGAQTSNITFTLCRCGRECHVPRSQQRCLALC